jgi:hypothetical protein
MDRVYLILVLVFVSSGQCFVVELWAGLVEHWPGFLGQKFLTGKWSPSFGPVALCMVSD